MLITCRPDITFAIGKTSRGVHQHQPTRAHVAYSLKHLISYMWKTRDYKFRYFASGCNGKSHLRGIIAQDASISFYAGSDGQQTDPAVGFFADANIAHVSDEQRKSISGYCFFVYFCLICWRSKLRTVTAQSTHEAELIAVALASNELIWIRKFMIEVGFAIGARTPITLDYVARPMISPALILTCLKLTMPPTLRLRSQRRTLMTPSTAILIHSSPLVSSTTTRAQHRRL